MAPETGYPDSLSPLTWSCSAKSMSSLVSHSWFVIAIVALLGFLIGFSKGGFTALYAVLTPLLSLVLPNVALAVGILLPMLMVARASSRTRARG